MRQNLASDATSVPHALHLFHALACSTRGSCKLVLDFISRNRVAKKSIRKTAINALYVVTVFVSVVAIVLVNVIVAIIGLGIEVMVSVVILVCVTVARLVMVAAV